MFDAEAGSGRIDNQVRRELCGLEAAPGTPRGPQAAIRSDHGLNAACVDLQSAAAPKMLDSSCQLRRQPVPMYVPVRLQVPQEAALLGSGQPPPEAGRQFPY